MKNPHHHSFDSIKTVKVIADNPKYSIAKHGAKSLIVRYCSCGKELGIDYLPREAAAEKLELLIN